MLRKGSSSVFDVSALSTVSYQSVYPQAAVVSSEVDTSVEITIVGSLLDSGTNSDEYVVADSSCGQFRASFSRPKAIALFALAILLTLCAPSPLSHVVSCFSLTLLQSASSLTDFIHCEFRQTGPSKLRADIHCSRHGPMAVCAVDWVPVPDSGTISSVFW